MKILSEYFYLLFVVAAKKSPTYFYYCALQETFVEIKIRILQRKQSSCGHGMEVVEGVSC